eukprot:TRINITY_DN21321_c0_g1_i1.p1 TRINITY_DN21321_c0_g1~~TRINITY_DN21321_c0_g1_i1.p1  ORF type:complete len:343 (+),score=67.33 TRINITY_DN21321_c0_g1_i1:512-1540(+)
MLDAKDVRHALKSLNVKASKELLATLMAGHTCRHHQDISRAIHAELVRVASVPALGQSRLPRVPFAVPVDGEAEVKQMVARMRHRWGFIERAFRSFDVDGAGTIDQKQFEQALKTACPDVCLRSKEIRSIFADADVSMSGRLSFNDFKVAFGKGSLLAPEFLKPVGIRQSRGGPIWACNPLPAASNASRKFRIEDKGVTRYHCKQCHLYLLPKEFSRKCIDQRIHTCLQCSDAAQDGFTPGRHCRTTPRSQWPTAPKDEPCGPNKRGHPCTEGGAGVPWATSDKPMFSAAQEVNKFPTPNVGPWVKETRVFKLGLSTCASDSEIGSSMVNHTRRANASGVIG